MFIAVKINKNKGLLDLVSKHAETIGYKRSVHWDTNQSLWFWCDKFVMRYGTESKPTTSWVSKYEIMDVADFLDIKPAPKELKIGCKTFQIDDDLIHFCGYTPMLRQHSIIRKIVEVYENPPKPQEFKFFGFKLEVSPGKVVADGEEIKNGIDEFIKWAKGGEQ